MNEDTSSSDSEGSELDKILTAVKVPFTHPQFFSRLFAIISKERLKTSSLKSDSIEYVIRQEYDELSRRLERSQIQEGCSVRNILRSKLLANLLIDEKGEIDFTTLDRAIKELNQSLFSLGPGRRYDSVRQKYLLKSLETLKNNKQIHLLLKKISKPLGNKISEDFIRDTLQLPHSISITDAHAKKAALSAFFCYLRQNVGSCFATAPACVIHNEQPEQFFQDILDLLSTGTLKRTFEGNDYAVPLSVSWGKGDLKKPILLTRTPKGIEPQLWYSPGLLEAFETTGFITHDEPIKNKINQLKNWLEPYLFQKSLSYPIFFVNAEDLIRQTMMQLLGITEQNLIDFENRPKGMIQSQLMMQVVPSKGATSLGERCSQFLFLFDRAKNAFKALSDNAILKAWEFTLASFSETKLEFTQWNLYSSLGMGTQEPGGIGQCIQETIQHKLDEVNRTIQDTQAEYEMVYTQVKTAESRVRQATSEKEMQWLKMEYQNRTNEFYFIQEQRDMASAKAQKLVNLYESLYSMYLGLFKDYFQEVYDAEMQEVATGPFDDAPAGFRLLYKHGRSQTGLWTRIQNPQDFVDALSSFFVITESQIIHAFEKQGLDKEISEVVTAIVNHVKTKEFLESSFHRMAAAHGTRAIKDPLEHLEYIEKKPWAYTSGGTMNTLVNCYYKLGAKPTETEKWVESEVELMVFLIDVLKQMPPKYIKPYIDGDRKGMLMQSPTHAFVLTPVTTPFKEFWERAEEFTYTAVRDQIINPATYFIESILLDEEMMQFIIQQLVEKVPANFQPRFKDVFARISGPLNPILFRQYIVDTMSEDRGLRYGDTIVLSPDVIDSYLQLNLPLIRIQDIKEGIRTILSQISELSPSHVEKALSLFDEFPFAGTNRLITSHQLQCLCKALLCLIFPHTQTEHDFHFLVSLAAKNAKLSMPRPFIFADTNWVKDLFGFVVNPGTGFLELWRIDYTGNRGYPMSDWKQWLNGSRPDRKWGVYIKPPEYGQN